MASSLRDHLIYVPVVIEILYLYLLSNSTIARVHEPPVPVKFILATAPKEEKTERSTVGLTSFASPDTSRCVRAGDITLHGSQLVRIQYPKLREQLCDLRRMAKHSDDLRRLRRLSFAFARDLNCVNCVNRVLVSIVFISNESFAFCIYVFGSYSNVNYCMSYVVAENSLEF